MRSFLYSLDFSLKGLMRRKGKYFSITLLFALIVFLFSGIDFMTHAIYLETLKVLDYQPEIIVQNVRAGRQMPIETELAQEIARIPGVTAVVGRVWGYYFDPYTGANYTMVGVPGDFPLAWDLILDTVGIGDNRDGPDTACGIEAPAPGNAYFGEGILKKRHLEVGELPNFNGVDGRSMALRVAGTFKANVGLWTHDMIVLNEVDARRLFGLAPGLAWDLAVKVPNAFEVDNVGDKIITRFPGCRIIAVDQLRRTYGCLFGFRSGMVFAVTSVCLFAFLILACDHMAGISREEQHEIAILKAVGWQSRDIIRLRMMQSVYVALTGFLVGIVLSYGHVFILNAPLFRKIFAGWSVLYPLHPLTPVMDLSRLTGLLFLTVVPYVAAGIVPVWRTSVRSPEEVLRT